MGALDDTRMQVLPIINEVRQKLGVPTVSSITADAQTQALLAYLNDVLDITSDYSGWKEMQTSITVTASSSVYNYLVNPVSAAVKNIEEVAFQGQTSPLRLATDEEMRRWRRSSGGGTGTPRYWIISGVDGNSAAASGNPYIEVWPQPGSYENNKTFDLLIYKKPSRLTAADVSAYVPFPARMIVNGLLAYALLDESRGTQNMDFVTQFKVVYTPMMEETYNRLNGDCGTETQFVPQRRGFRRA